MLATDVSELIGGIYATAETDECWKPLLDQFCSRLGVQSAVAQILEERPGRLEVRWNARDSVSHSRSAVHDGWANSTDNPRLTLGPSGGAPRGEIGSDQRLYGSDQSALRHLREGLGKIGLGQGFWAGFEVSHGKHFSVIMHRRVGDDRDLGASEEQLLNTMLPHLKQSLRLGTSLRSEVDRANSLRAALNRIAVPTLVCNADLTVDWSNDAALECLERSDLLNVVAGRLRGTDTAISKRVEAMVTEALTGLADGCVASFTSRLGAVYHLRVTPAGGFTGKRDRQVVIYLSPNVQVAGLQPGELIQLYGLTPAEARLAAAMAEGTLLNDFAERRGIAVGTARIQLKQVLAKTGTNRQAELVRELSGSVAAPTRSRAS